MKNYSDNIPTQMPTHNRPLNVGTSLDDQTSRLDGIAKVTGTAKFAKDQYLPHGLFAALIRCPCGAAELTAYNQNAAAEIPGVINVAIDRKQGRFHGHGIGHIIAESPTALKRALRALNPQWQRGPNIKTKITDTIGEIPAPSAETRKLLEAADHTFTATYSTQVQTHSSAETHGAVVDHQGNHAIVYASTQGTFATRDGLRGALGLAAADIRVHCEYVGGGFGSKLQAGPEAALAAKLSRTHQRPVYVFVNRAEEHLDTGNRPGSQTHLRIAFKNDGTILGGDLHTYGNTGIGSRGGGLRFPSGRYRLGKINKNHTDIKTNAGAPRPFRAPGSPQGAFVEELLLDEIATIADIDPVKLRLKLEKNNDRREMLQQGAKLIHWEKRQPTGTQSTTIRRGFGVGSASWGRIPASAGADVVINRDGSVQLKTGSQDIGTGQRTAMAVVAANALNIPLKLISVKIGDSDLPRSPGSGGSMTIHNTEPAMRNAADAARKQLLRIVAEKVNTSPANLEIRNGNIIRNKQNIMSFRQACSLIPGENLNGHGTWDRAQLEQDSTQGHSHGIQFVDLSVDTETGNVRINRVIALQACGIIVCRKTAESQIIGGVIQGISYALFEDKILDPLTGTMLNPNLENYKIAGSRDIPQIEPVFYTKNQTGTRALGEPPTIPTAGAIAAAVFNAIGSPVRHLPITPDKILAALTAGEAKS